MQTVNIPDSAEATLRRAFGHNLDQAALEALAIEGYRSARLTAGEVAGILGLATSIEAVEWLTRHGVGLNYSLDDLQQDRATLARHFPELAR